MRKRGRPRKEGMVSYSISLPRELYESIDARRRPGQSKADHIRQIIQEWRVNKMFSMECDQSGRAGASIGYQEKNRSPEEGQEGSREMNELKLFVGPEYFDGCEIFALAKTDHLFSLEVRRVVATAIFESPEGRQYCFPPEIVGDPRGNASQVEDRLVGFILKR